MIMLILIIMKRINVLISDEARETLKRFQEKNKISTIDETVDQFILSRSKDNAKGRK